MGHGSRAGRGGGGGGGRVRGAVGQQRGDGPGRWAWGGGPVPQGVVRGGTGRSGRAGEAVAWRDERPRGKCA
ncbi:hypothetical protein SGPA1_11393 [Streptomyces misionensis JCM 4497]